MANIYLQGCFTFACTNAEMALIEEAFQASYDLMDGRDPAAPSPEILAAFPPTAKDEAWSGFRKLFPDPDYPTFGADLEGGNSIDQPDISYPILSSTIDFQPVPIAALIQRCCPASLARKPVGFEWAESCSSPRIGEFGGGWCAIFTDRIEIETTGEALARALEGGVL